MKDYLKKKYEIDLEPYYNCDLKINSIKNVESFGDFCLDKRGETIIKLLSCEEQSIVMMTDIYCINNLDLIGYSDFSGYTDYLQIISNNENAVRYKFYLQDIRVDEGVRDKDSQYECKRVGNVELYDNGILIKNRFIHVCRLKFPMLEGIVKIVLPFNPNIYILKMIARLE